MWRTNEHVRFAIERARSSKSYVVSVFGRMLISLGPSIRPFPVESLPPSVCPSAADESANNAGVAVAAAAVEVQGDEERDGNAGNSLIASSPSLLPSLAARPPRAKENVMRLPLLIPELGAPLLPPSLPLSRQLHYDVVVLHAKLLPGSQPACQPAAAREEEGEGGRTKPRKQIRSDLFRHCGMRLPCGITTAHGRGGRPCHHEWHACIDVRTRTSTQPC